MYERNYELLRAKFSEFFLPTLFTSMAGNICLFVDGLIVTFLLGAGNLSAIQIVAPVITFVNNKQNNTNITNMIFTLCFII
jgi:Na+-driven multidrug efflux pump